MLSRDGYRTAAETLTVTVVPGDGDAKHEQVHVQELKGGGQPMKVQVHRLEASSGGDLSKQWPKIEQQLKAAGVDAKKTGIRVSDQTRLREGPPRRFESFALGNVSSACG
jgi:hypothetical protein